MTIYFKTPYSELRKVTRVKYKDKFGQVCEFDNKYGDKDYTIVYFPDKHKIYLEITFEKETRIETSEGISNVVVKEI